ncbi:MAG: type II toxin-antitoxin system VapC family toxin, partial [Pseudomonadota bacterium]
TLGVAMPEVANAIWNYVRAGQVAADDAASLLATVSLLAENASDACYLPDALTLSIERTHPVCDCMYVVYAAAMHAPLITANKILSKKFADVVPAGIINLYDELETS